jgi:hypothetical protein
MDPYANRRYPAVPGQGYSYPSGDERVGTAQRTTVIELLSRAVGEGYLDLDEYEARVARVTEGKTVATLYTVVADLPPQFRWDPVQPMPKSRQEKERESAQSMAVASLALGAAAIPISMCFGTGGLIGLVAVFLGRRGLRDDDSRAKAITGMVLGAVSVAISLGIVLLVLMS